MFRQSKDKCGIQSLLTGHSDKVNAIRFFPYPLNGSKIIILSGSVDKTIRIWCGLMSSSLQFSGVSILEGHAGSVNCFGVCSNSDVFASGAADGTIKIWRTEASLDGVVHGSMVQSITTTPSFLPLALALHRLEEGESDSLMLAIGGTTSIIHVYVTDKYEHGIDFAKQLCIPGHEGWVRCLNYTWVDRGSRPEILLVSASQDKHLRLWRIRQVDKTCESTDFEQIMSTGSISNKVHQLTTFENLYSLTFEALLVGHEDWIYSASWRYVDGKLQLLSASADNSLAIWEMDTSSGTWVCKTRIGEISNQKGSFTATGTSGGLWTGLWSPSGDVIVGLGRNGSWRRWSFQLGLDQWTENLGVSGHFKEVQDMAWTKDGSCLLSTSSDQTTRLHARWVNGAASSWHEFARPQIHGFDLNCIDTVGLFHFVSGADEKLIRVFEEPQMAVEILEKLCNVTSADTGNLPKAANIPVLGLSNKSVDVLNVSDHPSLDGYEGNQPGGIAQVLHKDIFSPDRPPLEGQLARHTLWPEKEKLYGHGYEISSLAASNDGSLIATACKASSPDFAVIRLYKSQDWREVKPPLKAHSLTVTSLRFSDDDSHLLSVGRDRQWVIFQRDSFRSHTYHIRTIHTKAHMKMILGAAWAPSDLGRLFATAGRDKLVKFWVGEGSSFEFRRSILAPGAVTAVDIRKGTNTDYMVLALGTESGGIFIHLLNTATLEVIWSEKFANGSVKPEYRIVVCVLM